MTTPDTITARWPDISGRLVNDNGTPRHELPVRVYFEDTDAGGVVYHASFVRYAERGRTDFLRLLGTDARRMIDGSQSHEPAAFVVRRMNMDFFKPGRMDDLLLVSTIVLATGGASVTLRQTISRAGTRLFETDVTVVLVSMSGRPLRLSERVRAAFDGHKAAAQ
ncbi:MAG: YbgC/FadM family acyl-CoA thioesterase [Hyphomicrobium sp.]